MNITMLRMMKAMIEPIKKVFPDDCNNIYMMPYKLLRMRPNKAATLKPFMTKNRYHVIRLIQAIAATMYAHAKA